MKTFIPWRKNFVKRHEDFEIFEHNNKFCFTIDYIGTFQYATRKDADTAVVAAREYVQQLLDDIERQNQMYYESINRRMEEQNEMLHNAKAQEKKTVKRKRRITF